MRDRFHDASVGGQGYVHGVSSTYTKTFSYDTHGRLQTFIGPRTDLTQKTQYAYYSDTDSDLARRCQLHTITDPVGHIETMAGGASPYNTFSIYGRPRSVSDPNGVVSNFTYDLRGRLTTSSLLGVIGDTVVLNSSVSYDETGRATKLTLPFGNAIALGYDALNNLTSEVLLDSGGLQREQAAFGYDPISQQTSKAYQTCLTPAATCSSWVTHYSDATGYTNAGNPATTTFTGGAAESNSWDTSGNFDSTTIGDANFFFGTVLGYDGNHDTTNIQNNQLGNDSATLAYNTQRNLNLYTPSIRPAAPSTPTTILAGWCLNVHRLLGRRHSLMTLLVICWFAPMRTAHQRRTHTMRPTAP